MQKNRKQLTYFFVERRVIANFATEHQGYIMTKEEQKELDVSLWREWNRKASMVNCCKFCSSVVDDVTSRQLLRYVQGYDVPPEITGLIDRIVDGTYVPPNLDCTLNCVPQRHHLMYKIESLDHPSGRARYEFLVEYDRMEPTVGIYLGCKCITLGDADHRAMIDMYMQEWNSIRHHICTVLNNSFPTKEFRHRFRVTNNGENNTFWPSWIGLYDDEDMEFALAVLRIMRNAYRQYFNGTLTECGKLPPIPYRHVPASFTASAFDDLTESMGNAYGRDRSKAAKELFSKFVMNATELEIFMEDPSYDYALRYIGNPSMALNGSNIEFSTIMHLLTLEIGNRVGCGNHGKSLKTPWENIWKVFLDSKGVAFKGGTRTQWQNALSDTLSVCSKAVAVCLDRESQMS